MSKKNNQIGSTDLFTAARIADDATKDLYTYSATTKGGFLAYCGTSYTKAKNALFSGGLLCTWLDGQKIKTEQI